MTVIDMIILDANGDEIDRSLFKPHVAIPVQIVDVRVDETCDKITYIVRYVHDKPDEELGEEVPRIVPREAD